MTAPAGPVFDCSDVVHTVPPPSYTVVSAVVTVDTSVVQVNEAGAASAVRRDRPAGSRWSPRGAGRVGRSHVAGRERVRGGSAAEVLHVRRDRGRGGACSRV